MSKKEEIRKMLQALDGVTDNLNLPIDPGIKKTVAYLRLLGFITTESCEGHTTHGDYTPWVNIEDPDKTKSVDQWYERADNLEIVKLVSEYNGSRKGDDANALSVMPLYDDRGIVITIVVQVGHENSSVDKYNGDLPISKALKEAQKEMGRFTDFLIKKLHHSTSNQPGRNKK